jgi:hypothetical protein
MNSTRAYARHFFKSKLTVVYGNTTVYVFVVKLSFLINQLVDDAIIKWNKHNKIQCHLNYKPFVTKATNTKEKHFKC